MERPSVNPALLIWARQTAGLDLDVAARKLGFINTKKRSAAERLTRLESGEEQVSRPTLVKMSQQYHRSLLAFYLPEPPQRAERGSDFRTLPEEKRREDAPTLDALVRDIRIRQSLVRSLLTDDEDFERLPFVGRATLQTPIADLAAAVSSQIGFDRETFRKGDVESAFKYLRSRIEASGVFVLLLGNLGTYRTNIDADIFRGFVVADDVAPFIVVNDQDARMAWSFTLLHELIHIWLGLSGISGGPVEATVERYCNDVASTILLSPQEIQMSSFTNDTDVLAFAGEVSRRANVSRALILYRLFRQGSLNEQVWRSLTDEIQREWRVDHKRKKEDASANRDAKRSGPSYYTVQRFHLGRALVDLVRRSINEGVLSPTKAGQVLGVKAVSVHPLISGKAA